MTIMNKLLYVIIPSAVALTMAATSCGEKKEKSVAEAPIIDVAEAQTDSVVLHKSYPGYLQADKAIQIVGRVSGTLLTQNYTNGEMVTKGQLLFTIEPTQYADAVKEAQAALASARSSYEYASSHYAAVKKALESNAVSQMEVNQAKSDMDQAAASIRSAEAQLRTAQTNLGYCRIYAPVSGRMSAATVNAGSFISGEASPFTLATIYDDKTVNAVFSVEDAAQMNLISAYMSGNENSKIDLEFENPLPHRYSGHLNYVGPNVNTGTGTLLLKAVVENPYGELRDGMYVNVSVPYATDPKAVTVNDASIGTDQLGRYLYVVNDSNKIVYTPVKVGEPVNDSVRIITSGIKAGDRYVTKALLKVRDGMSVKPRVVKF